jgi:hypothetical protein
MHGMTSTTARATAHDGTCHSTRRHVPQHTTARATSHDGTCTYEQRATVRSEEH